MDLSLGYESFMKHAHEDQTVAVIRLVFDISIIAWIQTPFVIYELLNCKLFFAVQPEKQIILKHKESELHVIYASIQLKKKILCATKAAVKNDVAHRKCLCVLSEQ